MKVEGDPKCLRVRRGLAAVSLVVLAAGTVAGCSQSRPVPATPAAPAVTPESAETSTPSASSGPTAAALLTCDDLASKTQIITALAAGQTSENWVVVPASTADGLITGEKAVEGAGGLSCSWRAGPPDSEAGPAILSVSILPGAAKQWTGQLYGDGPTSDRRTFAGISAAATCGDPGCGASAAVGSSWVRVDLLTGSREGSGPAFAKESDDQVFDGLRPAVESSFRAVQGASAAQLRFPSHVPANGGADCTSLLKSVDLAKVLGVPKVRVSTDFPPDPKTGSIFAAAELRTGTSICIAEDARYSYATELASVTAAPGQAWAVQDIAAHPAQQGTLRTAALTGLASGERALSSCGSSKNACTVVFTLGSDAVQVDDTPHAEQVAEAILAGAR